MLKELANLAIGMSALKGHVAGTPLLRGLTPAPRRESLQRGGSAHRPDDRGRAASPRPGAVCGACN